MPKLKLLNTLKEEVTEQGYGHYFRDWKTSDGKTVGDTRGFDFTTNKPFDKDYKNVITPTPEDEEEIDVGGGGAELSANETKLVDTAKSKIGRPYLWGGNGPDKFDCSGYVRWVIKNSGGNISEIPRTAHYMYKKAKKVSENDLQPGDLVFIDTSDRGIGFIDHVGMVISPKGSDKIQMIHASGSKGVNVVDDLKTSWYKNTIAGYGRFE
jgi:cell wall-associated NlpC family hydrolase